MVDMTQEDHDALMHIGIIRKSGRYPWGSGATPQARSRGFKDYMDMMTKPPNNLTHAQIAKELTEFAGEKVTVAQLRAGISHATEIIRNANVSMAEKLADKGLSNEAIAERMLGSKSKESTVRGWLKGPQEIKEGSIRATAEMLKEQLITKPFLDVGEGVHLYLGITHTKLQNALALIQEEGYKVHPNIKVPQLGTDKMTTLKVLTKGDVTWSQAREAVVKRGELRVIAAQSDDGGLTFKTPTKALPTSVDSKRVDVRYREDGGATMDGVIELRRGVPNMDLGANRYAQVRIAVDGTHFIKGMAMYADDLPPGVDMRFNTNKSNTGNKLDAMKPLKTDADGKIDQSLPFGSITHPRVYVDKDGKEHDSVLNIVGTKGAGNIEGRWDQWSRSVSSQMLSKQPVSLAKEQLGKALTNKEKELDEIMRLTNPVVKKKLLTEFSESADSDAVHLKAAAFDRQSTHVLLPMNSMRPTEIYAPNFNTGERVALVRHPHGGPFEIPELTVNNNNRTAKRILQNATDAVGIHHSVAARLSGADFDGDAVLVIPNDKGQIKSSKPLAGLEKFDPKTRYTIPDDDTVTTRMTKQNTQTEMGKISNLITDMTILGADSTEIAAAVRHSMVVIDAEKHGLNYKQSEIDNGISHLKSKYQKVPSGSGLGAATIVSRARSRAYVPQRKLRPAKDGGPIDLDTGELVYVPTGATRLKTTSYTSKRTGETTTKTKIVPAQTKGTKMEFAVDARELLSGGIKGGGTPMEETYALHANAMKSLANTARLESTRLTMPSRSPIAKEVYGNEVASLDAKLRLAQSNAPLERRAQVVAGSMAQAKIDATPGLDKDGITKIKYQALNDARLMTGANKDAVYIEDREWEAIQAGAVSHTKLSTILTHSDPERVRELATPRIRTYLTPGQLARARQMQMSGRPMSEIADTLGIPRSTIADNLST